MNATHAVSDTDDRRPPAGPAPMDAACARRWGALLDRMANGDIDASAAFYDESSGVAFSLILHILQDRDAAEATLLDLYLDVRDRAQRHEHRDQDPFSWVMGLARRAALARLRQTHRSADTNPPRSRAPGSRPSVVAFQPAHRERQRTDLVLPQLTEEQRSILQLVYFGGLTAREAAQQLRLPLQRVIAAIHSALCALRTCKDSEPSDAPPLNRIPGTESCW